MNSKIFRGLTFDKPGRAINLDQGNVDELIVENCTFIGTAGIFVQAKPGMKISIQNNICKNVIKTKGMEYAQFCQVSGLGPKGNYNPVLVSLQIMHNQITNELGVCDVEDVINMIMISGTAKNPLLVEGNTIQGASPKDTRPLSMQNYSGGGILADRGCCYALIQRNTVHETTNYGIGIAGGSFNAVRVNTVSAEHAINVGIYCANQYKKDPFKGNVVTLSNAITWKTLKGRNDRWVP